MFCNSNHRGTIIILSKHNIIINLDMLRNDGNGTSLVAIAKHSTIHTRALPKYVASNLRGPKLV